MELINGFKMIRFLLCMAVAMLMLGCTSAPSNQVGAFAQSSLAISEQVDTVFDEFNNASLERQFTDVAANYKGDFAQRFNQQLLAQINAPLSAAKKRELAIYRANQALSQYATALSELSNAAVSQDIDAASIELYGTLISFNAQYQLINGSESTLFDDESMATIQAAISAIGSEVVEQKKRRALKVIIISAGDRIDKVCNVIIEQLTNAGVADGIAASRKYVLLKQIEEYRLLSKKGSSKLKARTKEVKRLWQLQQALINTHSLVTASIDGVKEIQSAHKVLVAELTQDRYASVAITNAIGRLQHINTHFKALGTSLVESPSE